MPGPALHSGPYWRTVAGVLEHKCGGCKVWFPRTGEHFHKYARDPDGLQHWCKTCVNTICNQHQKQKRLERRARLERASRMVAMLPPLQALDAITSGWTR